MQVLDFNIGIDFGSRGNLREFSPVGFSTEPDDGSTWSERATAALSFRTPPMRGNLRIAIVASPFIAERAGITEQECWIFLNGLLVHFAKLRDSTEIGFGIGRDQLALRGNQFSFVLPNAASPSELGIGNDVRQLGLAFVKLTATPDAGL